MKRFDFPATFDGKAEVPLKLSRSSLMLVSERVNEVLLRDSVEVSRSHFGLELIGIEGIEM